MWALSVMSVVISPWHRQRIFCKLFKNSWDTWARISSRAVEFSGLCIWPSTEPGCSSQKHCVWVKVCASWRGGPQHSPHVHEISLLPACTAWIRTPAKRNSSHPCFPFVSSLIKNGIQSMKCRAQFDWNCLLNFLLEWTNTPWPRFVLAGHKEELFCSEKHSQTLFKSITILTCLPGVTHDLPFSDLEYTTEASTGQINPMEASFILNWEDAADLFRFLPAVRKQQKCLVLWNWCMPIATVTWKKI